MKTTNTVSGISKFLFSTLVAAAAMTSTAWAEGTESTTPVLPTLTVDSSAKEGDEGFGVTKFATVDAAVKAAQSTSGATINLGMLSRPSDFPLRNDDSTLWRTNGDYTFAGGNYGDLFSWIQTPKPSEASDVHINIAFDKANVVAGKFRLDNGSSLTITDSHLDSRGYFSDNRGWTTFYGDSTINIKNSVVGYHAKDNATDGRDADSRNIVAGDKTTNYSSYDAGMVFGGSGVMTVEKSTIFALTNANRTYGALAVYARGLMEFKDSAVYARSLSIGIDDNSTVGRDEEVATMVFDASVLRDINGDDSAFIKVGDSLAGKLIVKNNAEIDHVNATMTVNNNGYVSVSDSTLKVGSLSNNGEFTVSGTSTLNIGTLSGNVIDLLDGATLTDSAVGGFMRVNGSVAIKGDSSVGRIDLGYGAYTQDATQLDITGTLASTAQIIIGNEDGAPSATVNIGAADSARTSASFSGALNVRENGIVNIVNADVTTSQYRNRGSVSVTNGTLYGTWESNGIASKVEGQVATLALDDATFKTDVEKNSHFTLNVGQVDSGSALTETAEGSGKITMENNSLLHVGKLNLYNAGEGMTVAVEADSSTINVVSDVYVGSGATVLLKNSSLKATNITNTGTFTMDGGTLEITGTATLGGTVSINADEVILAGTIAVDALTTKVLTIAESDVEINITGVSAVMTLAADEEAGTASSGLSFDTLKFSTDNENAVLGGDLDLETLIADETTRNLIKSQLEDGDLITIENTATGVTYTDCVYSSNGSIAVPEPSAFGLLAGLGAIALAVSRRRRNRR